jgi:ribosomal protein S18 acetylase RimI-like enzyme
MTLVLEPSTSFRLDELARIFATAYEDYFVPFVVDEGAMRLMVEAFDFDLAASRVALVDGEPVGLANLGVRGDRSWVGGVGVARAHRRAGIGRALMNALVDQARSLGLKYVTLEVMEQNEPAFRLYDELGFETTRWVEVWSLAGQRAGGEARDADVEQAHAQVRALRRSPEPWQRADETLAYYKRLDPPPFGLEADGGAAVSRPSDETIQVVQIAGDEAACRSLVETLWSRGPLTVLNLPADDPASDTFRALGGECRIRQREMVLAL